MRAGGGLGVILHAENRQAPVSQAFERLIVEIHVAWLDVGRQGARVNSEAVVLGGDLDLAGRLIPNRVVGPAVSKLELECLGPECLAQESDGPGKCRRSGSRDPRRPSG